VDVLVDIRVHANDVYNSDVKVGNYAPSDWFGEFGYTCDGIHWKLVGSSGFAKCHMTFMI